MGAVCIQNHGDTHVNHYSYLSSIQISHSKSAIIFLIALLCDLRAS